MDGHTGKRTLLPSHFHSAQDPSPQAAAAPICGRLTTILLLDDSSLVPSLGPNGLSVLEFMGLCVILELRFRFS